MDPPTAQTRKTGKQAKYRSFIIVQTSHDQVRHRDTSRKLRSKPTLSEVVGMPVIQLAAALFSGDMIPFAIKSIRPDVVSLLLVSRNDYKPLVSISFFPLLGSINLHSF